jgi:uncharacterized membrane protein YqjE
MPLYKHPLSTLTTVFIPLWILGLINLVIFFQSPELSGRLAAIATISLAFIALIPTIRE